MVFTNFTVGAAVFAAVLCGQPDLLTVLCLYLWATVGIVAGIIRVGRHSDAPNGHRPSAAK